MLITAVTTLRIQAITGRIADIVDDRAVQVELANRLDQTSNSQARYLRNAIIGRKEAGPYVLKTVRPAQNEFMNAVRAFTALQLSLQKVVSEVRQNSDNVATASSQIAQGLSLIHI